MTDEVSADFIYLKPLTIQSIEEILQERQIDCVLPTMGGQTALNLCKEASEIGLWQKYGVRIIGVDLQVIETTENREAFRKFCIDLDLGVAPSIVANSMLEGKDFESFSKNVYTNDFDFIFGGFAFWFCPSLSR